MSKPPKLNEPKPEDDAMPLDYSFKKLTTLQELKSDKPREGRVGRCPVRGKDNKFLTKSIWLNNNSLVHMEGFDALVDAFLENPLALGWIDFSFNKIKEIDKSILNYPNLKIVYFHGNLIEELDCVIMLKGLRNLKRLTLHGNPVTFAKNYRNYVVYFLPQLANLDFAAVLNEERRSAPPAGALKKYAASADL